MPDFGAFHVVGVDAIPPPVRALSSLPDADYADQFTLPTAITASPEEWARAMFGDVPDRAERLIWRGLLGIRLQRGRSPHTVAGWRIGGRGESWVRLEAASRFLTGNLLVHTSEHQVSLATFVRYDRPWGRWVWTPLSAVHRWLTPGLLREATTTLAARRDQHRA